MLRIPGIAALEDNFQPAKELRGTPGILDLSVLHFHFYTQMTFNAGNRIHRYGTGKIPFGRRGGGRGLTYFATGHISSFMGKVSDS
jgi:hypothetical protein